MGWSRALHIDDVSLGELVEAVFAIGAADAAFAPAGVEALHGLEVFAVDVGLAEVDLLAGAEGGVEVAGVDAGGEAVVGIVSEIDGLVEVVELHDGDYGAEDFAADDVHALGAAGEHGGLIVVAAFEREAVAAGD